MTDDTQQTVYLARFGELTGCPHCGARLILTASGAVCEHFGCGGIHIRGSKRQAALADRRAKKSEEWLALPLARYYRTGPAQGHWEISGITAKWRRVENMQPDSLECRTRLASYRPPGKYPTVYLVRMEESG